MTTNDRSTIPLIIAMLAIVFAVFCTFLSRSYRLDQTELDRIADDIRRTELMVERARRNTDELTPENVRDAEQQIGRLGDRLSELKSKGPDSLTAKALELLAIAGMSVSILGNGLFIYRKATN